MPKLNVPDELRKAATIYEERNKLYGDNYANFGNVMVALFGELTLSTANDYTRFALIILMTAKLDRYSRNFNEGGHDDSLDDLSVYSQMLKEVDNMLRGP